MPKRAIPAVPRSAAEHRRTAFDDALKENLEEITGRRGTPLRPLAADATLAEAVAKINEIIARLQD